MAYDAHKNFGYSTVLSGGVVGSSSGTTLTVQSNDGSNFAASMNVTVWPAGVNPTTANAEIMRITNVLLDTLTVTRAQEGSSVLSNITAGYQVADTITAKDLTDVEGLLYNPYKFSVYRNAAANSGNGAFALVTFDTKLFDTSSNYSTSTGLFTAPISGFYQINFSVQGPAAFSWLANLTKNGTGTEVGRGNWAAILAGTQNLTQATSNFSHVLQLTANDTLQVNLFSDTTRALVTGLSETYFSGFLVSTT